MKREWRGSVEIAIALGMYKSKPLLAVTGISMTAVCSAEGELFTFGSGSGGRLGHEEQHDMHVPRLVEALAGKKVVGAAARGSHTVAWTEAGELFIFGAPSSINGQLGHGVSHRMSLCRGGSRRRWGRR